MRKHKVGDRVSRMVFCDDGTWRKLGDKCLSSSPIRCGTVLSRSVRRDDEILVQFDDGEENTYLDHGVEAITENSKHGKHY